RNIDLAAGRLGLPDRLHECLLVLLRDRLAVGCGEHCRAGLLPALRLRGLRLSAHALPEWNHPAGCATAGHHAVRQLALLFEDADAGVVAPENLRAAVAHDRYAVAGLVNVGGLDVAANTAIGLHQRLRRLRYGVVVLVGQLHPEARKGWFHLLID